MKLATYQIKKENRLGVVWQEKIIDFVEAAKSIGERELFAQITTGSYDMHHFLTQGSKAFALAKRVLLWGIQKVENLPAHRLPKCLNDMAQVKLLPPILNPPKIMCLARNYVSHVREVIGDGPLPVDLLIFMKPSTALIGQGQAIIVPPTCRELDHEIELAVIIGKKGRHIPEEKAMEHVAGYTIMNDISDREYVGKNDPNRRVNWFFMKAQDSFAPLGPYLVTKDEIKDPHNLRLRLWVNGELRQDSQGEEMIFKIPYIISRISRFVTLEPGDIISTGTPTGTSFSTHHYLKDGDVLECEIEGIGRLKNFVKVEQAVYRKR
ncbi:MAG: fumarylacetoacetate hydrolase family protein [Thermodesulfobacteriota bacterium]